MFSFRTIFNQSERKCLGALAAAAAMMMMPVFTAAPAHANPEKECFEFVQGNIPWNYDGATRWASRNIRNLCDGTNRAAEPGRCFDRVMHGSVNWGNSTKWQWKNALKLCKGANDANARISCFQGRISAGSNWGAAIADCTPASSAGGGSGGEAKACFSFVQGNIPWNYEGSSRWSPANIRNLCEGTGKAAEPGRCFDRVMHGGVNWGGSTKWQWKNALNLCKGTNNASATISCFEGEIGAGANWRQAINRCDAG